MHSIQFRFVPLLSFLTLFVGCSEETATLHKLERERPTPLQTDHLPNAYRITDDVISGGEPEGEAGFKQLHALGVRTVISVDGAKPDAETAQKHGLRYVHLPHGYDGISHERALALAKAVRDLPGPIYIHCHHGKHRSPTAAAVACVGAGLLSPERARGVLEAAGTSPHYRGLYRDAERAEPFASEVLDRLEVEFSESVQVPPMAASMVAIEHTFNRLHLISKGNWVTPKDHPDLEPAHEALILHEHFTELMRTPDVAQGSPHFLELLSASQSAASELEQSLRDASNPSGSKPDVLFERVRSRCTACHRAFRD